MENANLRILVVDDERAIRRYLRTTLIGRGFDVLEAAAAGEALQKAVDEHPDLMILDLGLPDLDGVEVVRRVREWSKMPIIILSVRDREDDKVSALDAGADDYLTKPFGMGELLARIRVAMRHSVKTSDEPVYELDQLRVDLARREVTLAGERVGLTPTEYELLRALVLNAGKVMTHNQLLRLVWGAPYVEESHLLRVNISNLRKKIEINPDQPKYIITEPGVGYRLVYP